MSDTNYILYQDDGGVRHIEKLRTDKRISVIGFQRFSELLHNSEGNYYAPEPNGSYPVITDDMFKDMFGKVLTVVDASFPEGTQKEAFKSLVKSSMSEWYNKNTDYTRKMSEQAVKLGQTR